MKSIFQFFGRHLAMTGVVVFGVLAGIPWARAAWKAQQGEAGLSVERVVAEKRADERKEAKERGHGERELKVAWVGADGVWYFGTKAGLVMGGGEGGQLQSVDGGPTEDVRSMAGGKGGEWWVAAKDGVWVGSGREWRRVLEDDAHSVTVSGEGPVVVVTKKRGAVSSADGGVSWQPVAAAATFREGRRMD
jgi:hypothetical protein